VTRHPTAEWLARQITEAFPWASAPAYLVRDNDRAYGPVFRSRVRAMGIRDRPISPGSPWQKGVCGASDWHRATRECIDRLLIFGEAHLRRVVLGLISAATRKSSCCGVRADGVSIASAAPKHRFFAGGASMKANKAYFMVRAQVANESDRAKFDQWYGTHHLPLAMDNFLGASIILRLATAMSHASGL
jgi:hypothetical protein